MPGTTLKKFGIDDNLIVSYQHWHLLLRFKQTTLGALILICKGPYTAFSSLPEAVSQEMHVIIAQLESVLKSEFNYSKINYLMLMMVDPEVHFHIIPRYQDGAEFDSVVYPDVSWPGPPGLANKISITKSARAALLERLRNRFSESKINHPTGDNK